MANLILQVILKKGSAITYLTEPNVTYLW